MSAVETWWRETQFGGRSSRFGVDRFTGWIATPAITHQNEPSLAGHGTLPTPGVMGARIVRAGGRVRAHPRERDAIIDLFDECRLALAADDSSTEPLRVTLRGRTDTAGAQLQDAEIDVDPASWHTGRVRWSMTWRCPDPSVYGEWQYATAALTAPTAGVLLPADVPFVIPDQILGGQLRVMNPGNDPSGSPTIITLTGQQPGNVGVRVGDATLTYGFGLSVGDVLRIDTELGGGGAYLNGEYRAPLTFSNITSDLRLRPGANLIRALGMTGSGDPTVSVAWRPRSQ